MVEGNSGIFSVSSSVKAFDVSAFGERLPCTHTYKGRVMSLGVGLIYCQDLQEPIKPDQTQKAPIKIHLDWGFYKKYGDDLLSHTVARAVPSALKSLTSVFGMGTGGSSLL